jgi:hypothetical protein
MGNGQLKSKRAETSLSLSSCTGASQQRPLDSPVRMYILPCTPFGSIDADPRVPSLPVCLIPIQVTLQPLPLHLPQDVDRRGARVDTGIWARLCLRVLLMWVCIGVGKQLQERPGVDAAPE